MQSLDRRSPHRRRARSRRGRRCLGSPLRVRRADVDHDDLRPEGHRRVERSDLEADLPAGLRHAAAPAGGVAAKYPGMGLYDGFSDTSGQGRYTPSKVLSVQNGALDFWLRSDRGQPLAAAVMPDGYAPHRTGRVSIRYKTTKTPGYKFVVILWPSSDRWNEARSTGPKRPSARSPDPRRPSRAACGTAP